MTILAGARSEPELGILYAMHSRPKLAARSGHVSEWSISNVATMSGSSLAETWRARDTLAIHLPGQCRSTLCVCVLGGGGGSEGGSVCVVVCVCVCGGGRVVCVCV